MGCVCGVWHVHVCVCDMCIYVCDVCGWAVWYMCGVCVVCVWFVACVCDMWYVYMYVWCVWMGGVCMCV